MCLISILLFIFLCFDQGFLTLLVAIIFSAQLSGAGSALRAMGGNEKIDVTCEKISSGLLRALAMTV